MTIEIRSTDQLQEIIEITVAMPLEIVAEVTEQATTKTVYESYSQIWCMEY